MNIFSLRVLLWFYKISIWNCFFSFSFFWLLLFIIHFLYKYKYKYFITFPLCLHTVECNSSIICVIFSFFVNFLINSFAVYSIFLKWTRKLYWVNTIQCIVYAEKIISVRYYYWSLICQIFNLNNKCTIEHICT